MALKKQVILSMFLLVTLPGASEVFAKAELVRKSLILDLDADRGVKIVDGRVACWSNQVDFKAREFVATRDASHKKGTGHPALKEIVSAIGGHNAVVFKRQELINSAENAFDHLTTGSGYTWFAVMCVYPQVSGLKDVNSLFGNLKNCGKYEGFWAGLRDDNTLWTGSRNGITFGRWDDNNPQVLGPKLEVNRYHVIAGRMGAGTGNVTIELFVDETSPVASKPYPVNPDGNPSKMAIGQERDATNHPGHESFDGEIARLLMWERPLTDRELEATFSFLSGTYGLSGEMKAVRVSADGSRFVLEGAGGTFRPWGFNYDHDEQGRLLEDYWDAEWPKVQEDFREMAELGANVVRIHLQTGKFMAEPDKPNGASLRQLARLVKLAERTGLYLDITGLGCYHKKDVPEWYDSLSEKQRWDVQARFWEAIAGACAESPAVFCYDLMNEPILAGGKKTETEWLAGEFAGKHFVQRITLDLAGRTREQVAKAWVDKLAGAIRKHDKRHMITVGVIPWAHTWPNAKPLFYSKLVSENLDFACVHFYPKKGEVAKALTALAVYDIGKPLVIEEMFPLKCGLEELDTFIDSSRETANGWIGFYWGKTPEEYRRSGTLPDAVTAAWLEFFRDKADAVKGR